MTRRPPLASLRAALTILSVFLLMVAGAGGAGPITGPLHAVVICGDGAETTVWLDAEGRAHPDPQDCRSCPACHPAALDGADLPPSPERPARLAGSALPRPAGIFPANRDWTHPPPRGPPPFPSRNIHLPDPAGSATAFRPLARTARA